MDELYTNAMVEMGVSLTELAIKGTASAVNKKIRAVKVVKDAEKLRATYDALINEVLQEREEAVRIAQAYKAELDRIEISDDGKPEVEIEKIKSQVEGYEQIKELISVDTLKTMQLLGFNYKDAIGEPLTKLCANAISNWGSKNNKKR